MKTTKPYTPDIELISEQGLSSGLYEKLSALDGVKSTYGRMFGYVEATFDASRLTNVYKEIMGGISETDDGRFVPPEIVSLFYSYAYIIFITLLNIEKESMFLLRKNYKSK